MARPAKWASQTVAIRVPERFAAQLLEQAKKWDDGSDSFVQNPNDEFLEHLVETTLQRCSEEGVDPKELLLWLKFNETQEFLSHFTRRQQWNFIVRLMDSIPDS